MDPVNYDTLHFLYLGLHYRNYGVVFIIYHRKESSCLCQGLISAFFILVLYPFSDWISQKGACISSDGVTNPCWLYLLGKHRAASPLLVEAKAPPRIEVKSSWQPYGCGKLLRNIWRAGKRFHRQGCQLWPSHSQRRQHIGFQGKMDQKDTVLCFNSSVHQDFTISFKRCLLTVFKVSEWGCDYITDC